MSNKKEAMNSDDVSTKMRDILSMYISAKIPIKTSGNEIITDVLLKDNTIVLVTEKENTTPVEFERYVRPAYPGTCNWCESKFGFYDWDIITKPSKMYPSSLMMMYVKCPKCARLICIGNYPKRSADKGNYEVKTRPNDWKLDVIEYYERG